MVPNDDTGAFRQIFLARNDFEADPGRERHGVFEGAGGQILRNAVPSDEPKKDRNENSIDGADHES